MSLHIDSHRVANHHVTRSDICCPLFPHVLKADSWGWAALKQKLLLVFLLKIIFWKCIGGNGATWGCVPVGCSVSWLHTIQLSHQDVTHTGLWDRCNHGNTANKSHVYYEQSNTWKDSKTLEPPTSEKLMLLAWKRLKSLKKHLKVYHSYSSNAFLFLYIIYVLVYLEIFFALKKSWY